MVRSLADRTFQLRIVRPHHLNDLAKSRRLRAPADVHLRLLRYLVAREPVHARDERELGLEGLEYHWKTKSLGDSKIKF